MNKNIFREYDIRGIYPSDLNEQSIALIGDAISQKCFSENVDHLMIGRDGRLSGETLMQALAESIINNGINVTNIGLVTSPLLYFAAKQINSKSGIMVTGSHNPKEYNGIKMVVNDKPVSGQEIYQLLGKRVSTSSQGRMIDKVGLVDEYINQIKDQNKANLKKLKIVIDSGNGAAGVIAPKLFNELGCEVIELFSEIDGNFPNHHPDPGDPKNLTILAKEVLKEKADLGVAFDGDGDRLGVIDDKGNVVLQDKLLMIFCAEVLQNNPKAKIIYDVKCTNKLGKLVESLHGQPIMSPTGHFNIKNYLKKTGAKLAGEMSGHIFFNDIWYGFDDAHYSAYRLLKIIAEQDKDLSEIALKLPSTVSTPEISIDVKDEEKFKLIDKFIAQSRFDDASIITLDGIRFEYPYGWGLIRASNTSPKLVMRFEADNKSKLDEIINKFKLQFNYVFPEYPKIADLI